ncbi:MAG: MBL fold metallo-hydrolase [Nitrospinota bacterium]|nr:MBL fold metallo-hydrolase [Nitrospinota bacterium]
MIFGKAEPIFQFSVLASGSKGNAVYIESGQARILIDIGIGPRVLQKRLEHIRREPRDISALFLTHEHSDHISGAGALTKKHSTPVYGTRGTRDAMRRHVSPDVDWRTIQQEDEAVVGDLTVESFATPHDAAESVAYTVRCGSQKLGHITDLGKITPRVIEKLQSCDVLLVESNHDERMLENGNYPWPLKQRIQSDVGHLSNEACADLLARVKHDGLKTVVLMHLSESNNHPEIAMDSARRVLGDHPATLFPARQKHPSVLIPVG